MRIEISKILLLVLLIILIANSSAKSQNCADSVQLYGFISPDFALDPGSNVFLKLKNGNRCHVIYPTVVRDIFKGPVISMTDSTARLVKTKVLSMVNQEKFAIRGMVEAPDGAILILGQIYLRINGTHDKGVFLLKLNKDLEILWSRTIRNNFSKNAYGNYYLNGIACDENGSVFISYYYDANDGVTPVSVKNTSFVAVSAKGGILWSKALDYRFAGPFRDGYLTDVAIINDRIFFMGQSSINSLNTPRYGVIGMRFNKNNGNFLQCTRAFIPNYSQSVSVLSSLRNQALHVTNSKIFYGFGEYIDTTTNYACNLVTLQLDTLFNFSNVRRIKGQTSAFYYPGFRFNNKGDVAFSFASPSGSFAVVDTNNNVILSKNIGNSIFNNPQIRHIDFKDKGDAVSLSASNQNSNEGLLQMDIPLHSGTAGQACLGKDTIPFTFDTVSLVKQDFYPDTIYSDVVKIEDIAMQATDFTLQELQYCKVKSSCNTITLSGQTEFCMGSAQTFKVKKNQSCYRNVVWNTENIPARLISKNDTAITLLFDKPWKGYLKATLYDCIISDSIYISAHVKSSPVNLGKDTLWCSASTPYILQAGKGFKNYRWQDGSSDSVYIASLSGRYYVTAEDYCGNTYSDTIQILPSAAFVLGKTDTVICKTQSLYLSASDGFVSYTWSPPYNISSITGKTVSVYPDQTTAYEVLAEKFPGCILKDTIVVEVKDCPQYFYVPSAFTPNSDGKNEVFKPSILGATQEYEFSVYNRWGQLVYKTNDTQQGWNGFLKNKLQDSGAYIWLCRYQFYNQPPETKKGSVLLIR